jgi:nitrogen fixation/metabolism regulation signal transduction histidine kinase
MRSFQAGGTATGLLVLILIFLVLIALIIVFSQQILASLANPGSPANLVVYLVVLIFPLVLLGVIVYQLVRLARQRASRRPGSRLKSRLLAFFAFVALLSSIPQAVLSINFISSTINFWLRAGIGEALRGGLALSLDYYHGLAENLGRFNSSPLIPVILEDLGHNPERLWKNVQTTNSQIHFVQVFDGQGRELLFRGRREGRLLAPPVLVPGGYLPKEDRGGLSVLRHAAEHTLEDRRYVVVVGTVLASDFERKAAALTESLEAFGQLNRYNRFFRLVLIVFFFLFSLPIFLLSILVSFLLAGEIIQPIANLEEATRRVAEGDFSTRILTRSGDELAMLANSFNRMVSELAHSRSKLVQSEKITAWQEIAQRLAHEIKNPLTPIKLSAQRILKKYTGEAGEFRRVLEPAVSAIIREVDNLNAMLSQFRDFARLPMPKPERVLLRGVAEEAAAMYSTLSGKVTIDCTRIGADSAVTADRAQLKQVFANLFKNAIQAMADGGSITVASAVVTMEGRNFCRIWVRDTGQGIAEEIRDMVFRPYFTTKKEGTGLGLTIVERIVFDHAGNIRFESQNGVGTTFIIDLPAAL